VERALATPAGSVVLDLEDGVAGGAPKARARAAVADVLARTSRRVFVRVNATGTADHAVDLDELAPVLARAAGVVLPKAESSGEVAALGERLAAVERAAGAEPGVVRIVPVIETCQGLLDAAAIAAAPRVAGLVLGVLDLAAELDVSPGSGLAHARAHLAVAARAAGLGGPIDGPHPDLDDDRGLADTSRTSRDLGFSGRVVLHPRQIGIVERAYRPTDDELRHARRIVEAAGSGAGSLRLPDGTFVDKPVVARALALLADAGEVAPDDRASA